MISRGNAKYCRGGFILRARNFASAGWHRPPVAGRPSEQALWPPGDCVVWGLGLGLWNSRIIGFGGLYCQAKMCC